MAVAQGLHLRQDLILLRESALLLLREYQLIIQRYLEHASTASFQGYRAKDVRIVMKRLLRQTGGSGQVSSGSTVLDPHLSSVVVHKPSFQTLTQL